MIAFNRLIAISIYSNDNGAVSLASPARKIKASASPNWGRSAESIIDAGIHEGDTVLIKKTNLAENGDIVVALIDDHEATLKRLRKKGQSIALESANPLYETKILSAHRVKVQGKLIGLLRKY